MEQPFPSQLESKLNYAFKDRNLFALIITRRAAIDERLTSPITHTWTFSRLKFLGTRILRLLISDYLFKTHTTEGRLTTAHAAILSHDGTATEIARQISLGEALILGNGERLNAIHQNNKVLFEHMQVLFGALWVDCAANYSAVKIIFLHAFQYTDHPAATQPSLCVPESLVDLSKLHAFEERLRYKFKQQNLLLQALLRRATLEEKLVNSQLCFQPLELWDALLLNNYYANCLKQMLIS